MIDTIDRGPHIYEIDIKRFEKKTGMKLPNDYRQFLLLRNGGRPERDAFFVPGNKRNHVAGVHFFFGLNHPVESYDLIWSLGAMADRIPKELLPIATTVGNDEICLETTGRHPGRILFCDERERLGENIYPVAQSFTEFIDGLFIDENSPPWSLDD